MPGWIAVASRASAPKLGSRRRACLWLAVCVGVFPSFARAQALIEEDGFLVASIGAGAVRLESFVVRPRDAQGRLPIALIAHGKPESRAAMTQMRAARYAPTARDFARRGYLAVAVLRRGFGRSDGPSPAPASCASTSFAPTFEAAADDLQGALEVLARRPDADPDRVVLVGASAGGLAATALAARAPRGVRGVVNLSGGLKFDECPKPDLLVAEFARAGRRIKAKSLWVYAENDSYFPPPLVDRAHAAFLAAGADVRRVRSPALGVDGHALFASTQGRRRWLTEADAFLRDLGLPNLVDPVTRPLATKLNQPASQERLLADYLSAPGEKAMAVSKGGPFLRFQFGADSVARARELALKSCQEKAPGGQCEIVAENHDLVIGGARTPIQTRPAPGP